MFYSKTVNSKAFKDLNIIMVTGIIIYSLFLAYTAYLIIRSLIDKLYCDAILSMGVAVLFTQIFIVANYAGQFLRLGMDRVLNVGLQSVGMLLILACLVLLCYAFLSKRKVSNLTSAWGSTRLFLTQGIYGIIRHPIHLSGVLASLGIAFLMANAVVIALGIIASFAFILASKEEDRYSQKAIGTEYSTYMKTVPAFNFILGLRNKLAGGFLQRDEIRDIKTKQ